MIRQTLLNQKKNAEILELTYAFKNRLIELDEENYEWTKLTKQLPPLNCSVLICHNLGASGENYDVACYVGKDKAGNHKWFFGSGIQILSKDIIAWKNIKPYGDENEKQI